MSQRQRIISKNLIRRLSGDTLLNLLGTAIPLVALQLFVFPAMAGLMGAESYGLMQSSISVIYITGGVLGGALSTTRLVLAYMYESEGIRGDYNILVLFSIIIVIISVPIISVLLTNITDYIYIAMLMVVCILCLLTNYYEVAFRLNIDYKRIVICKFLSGIGYVIGYYLFCLFAIWQLVFIMSYSLQIVYCAMRSNLMRERYIKTTRFSFTRKSFELYALSALLSKALTYFDKLLLYPLLGGAAVSVYFAANLMGKLVLQVLEPFNNVVLSYLAKIESIGNHIWKTAVFCGLLFSLIAFLICLPLSNFFLGILYPNLADEAMPLVPVATFALCVGSYTSILTPFILKSAKASIQVIINGIGLIAYILLALLLYKELGIFGCCLALLVSYAIRLLVVLIVGFHCMSKDA